MDSITYRKVRDLSGFTGNAALYELSANVEYGDGQKTRFVIASAATVPFSGPETYIFPASETGEVLDWLELDGSTRGVLDHGCALRAAGFSKAA